MVSSRPPWDIWGPFLLKAWSWIRNFRGERVRKESEKKPGSRVLMCENIE